MIEDFISELDKTQRAINLLIVFLEEYINGDVCMFVEEETNFEKINNLSSLIYILNLLMADFSSIRQKYYKNMILKKYSKNID